MQPFLPPRINVIGTGSSSVGGYGWAEDGRLVCDVLRKAGFEVQLVHAHFYWGEGLVNDFRARAARELQGLRHRLFEPKDINVFLERVPHQLFPAARLQVLIPNQEWFTKSWEKHLPRFDAVICKTRAAQRIFATRVTRTYYSSFTSRDRRQPSAGPKRREFLMVLGRRRGLAEKVLPIWARHPEWPLLTVCGRNLPRDVRLPNVRLIHEFMPEPEITRLENETLFHLSPTKAEGFGHKLNEGFSCGAIVIATDAPPMNELVSPDRGFLVEWNESRPKALGTEYEFDPASLEQTLHRCLALDDAEIARLSTNARSWYETNDQFFRRTLPQQLRELLAAVPSRLAKLVPVRS